MQFKKQLSLNDFQYDLPPELVAQYPSQERDQARLFIRSATGETQHCQFKDLPKVIPSGSLLIVNDSRVFASRLFGHLETGGRVEVFLLASPTRGEVQALARPMKKLKVGGIVYFAEQVIGTIVDKTEMGETAQIRMQFNISGDALMSWIEQHGTVPLPPYIVRRQPDEKTELLDHERYQTVYAGNTGSVAAPTAGLHFSQELITELQAAGIEVESVTLHVGAGTFLPVKCEEISQHVMHEESYLVSKRLIGKIALAKAAGRPVIVIGTTSFRCLESVYLAAKDLGIDPQMLGDQWRSTDLFIRPDDSSSRWVSLFADAIITNFHQPGSTLLMLISALIGYDVCRQHYREAIAEGYRFFSYGDSNLFWF